MGSCGANVTTCGDGVLVPACSGLGGGGVAAVAGSSDATGAPASLSKASPDSPVCTALQIMMAQELVKAQMRHKVTHGVMHGAGMLHSAHL